MKTEVAVEFQKVTKAFGDVGLCEISTSVWNMVLVTLLGPSGCGKQRGVDRRVGDGHGGGNIFIDGKESQAARPRRKYGFPILHSSLTWQ